MTRNIPQRRQLLSVAVALSLVPIATVSYSQNATIEEVVVTGSFIRRSEGFVAASTVTQLSAEDLESQGTINMGEIVQNLSFVNGASSAVTDTIQGTDGNTSSVDLRGLGASSTLTLMDGKRVPTNNVNRLMPGIAIERLDIVVDGAAALYGSEAVAGVVNFIPVKRYDGAKVEFFTEGDDRGDFTDSQVSLLFGKELAPGLDFVFAGSFRSNDELKWTDRPDLMRAGLTFSGTANPGNFRVPQRDANGQLTGTSTTLPDPNCGAERQDPTQVNSNPNGFLLNGRCNFEFGDTRDYREEGQIANFYSNMSYEYSDDLTLSAQVNYSRQLSNGRSSTSNPGGRDSELPVVRGELPGNPFRAVNSLGQPLFALDANNDMLPDRDGSGRVIIDPNGIPFNEDVTFSGWRPLGKSNTLPSNFNSDGSSPDEDDNRDVRYALQADFNVPFLEGWEGTSFYTWMETESRVRNNQTLSFSAIEQGLNCDVLNDREACFNPFAVVDPNNLTSVNVMDSIFTTFRDNNKVEQQTFDLILNGSVPIVLPGGDIGAAIGYQRREDDFNNIPAANLISGDQFIGGQVDPFGSSRDIDAWFLELSFPILSNLEFSAAVRNEDFSTGQESTDPKFGLVYSPTDWLTLRGTIGESFIAPTLTQLNAPQECGLTAVDDPFSNFNAFVARCLQGNPDLVPESADNTSIGIDLAPIDGLRISVTWNETDFSDRIVATTTEDILRADFFNFQQITGFAGPGDPSLSQLTSWLNSGNADPRIVRDQNDPTKINTIVVSDSNASNMKVRATDLSASYEMDVRNMGSFRFGLNASYIDSYRAQISLDRPAFEGVGSQNNLVGGVPALPRWKANGSLGWVMGKHAANFTVHYIDDVAFDANPFAFQSAAPFSNFRDVSTIHAWTDADAFYTYRGAELFGGSSSLTLGLRNVFDRQAQKTGMFAGVVGELQDPLGRVIYARVNFEI